MFHSPFVSSLLPSPKSVRRLCLCFVEAHPTMEEAWQSQKRMLGSLCVGKYGGGDSQQLATTLLSGPLDELGADLADHLLSLKHKATSEAMKTITNLREDRRWADIALVDVPSRVLEAGNIEWQHIATVSDVSRLVDSSSGLSEDVLNLMVQGWVCDPDCSSGERLGSSNWPLLGVFGAKGLVPGPQPEKGQLDAFCGWESMNASDQHAHWVDDIMELDGFEVNLSDWHFGSDMARITLGPELVSTSWVVAVDPKRLRGLVVLLVLTREPVVLQSLLCLPDLASLSVSHLISLLEPSC